MTPANTYELLGLTVRSDVPLTARLGAAAPDLTIHAGSWDLPPTLGHVLAGSPETQGLSSLERHEGCYISRVPGVCAFRIDDAAQDVSWIADPPENPLVPIIASSHLMATVLGLRGIPTLHAAAISVEDQAIAFAGDNGMGKSTLAAVACAGGARLLTDDVLRVDDELRCYPGATQIRLRPASREVAARFNGRSSPTHDGRIAVQAQSAADPVSLRCVVLPRPRREVEEISLQRLSRPSAAAALLPLSRIHRWRAPAMLRAHLAFVAQVAERIPVCVADIPWGPPLPTMDDLLPMLLDAVRP